MTAQGDSVPARAGRPIWEFYWRTLQIFLSGGRRAWESGVFWFGAAVICARLFWPAEYSVVLDRYFRDFPAEQLTYYVLLALICARAVLSPAWAYAEMKRNLSEDLVTCRDHLAATQQRLQAGPRIVVTPDHELREAEEPAAPGQTGRRERHAASLLILQCENDPEFPAATAVTQLSGDIKYYYSMDLENDDGYTVPIQWYTDTDFMLAPTVFERTVTLNIGERRRFILAFKLLGEDEASYVGELAQQYQTILLRFTALPRGPSRFHVRIRGVGVDVSFIGVVDNGGRERDYLRLASLRQLPPGVHVRPRP